MCNANLKMNVPEAKDKRQPTPPSVSVPTLQIEILSDFISNVKNRPTSAHTKSLFVLTSYQPPLYQIILILMVSHKHRYLCPLPFSHFCLWGGLLENQFLVLGSVACQWMRRPALFSTVCSSLPAGPRTTTHTATLQFRNRLGFLYFSAISADLRPLRVVKDVRHGDRDLDLPDDHRWQDEEGDGVLERWERENQLRDPIAIA